MIKPSLAVKRSARDIMTLELSMVHAAIMAVVHIAQMAVKTIQTESYNQLKKWRKKMVKDWIQKALPTSSKGALHKEMGVPAGQKIPAKKLDAAAKKGGKLGQRARLAETLKKMK